jgi:hypothetical protein
MLNVTYGWITIQWIRCFTCTFTQKDCLHSSRCQYVNIHCRASPATPRQRRSRRETVLIIGWMYRRREQAVDVNSEFLIGGALERRRRACLNQIVELVFSSRVFFFFWSSKNGDCDSSRRRKNISD